jgi:hydroxycarboxylate dehydrogenase B
VIVIPVEPFAVVLADTFRRYGASEAEAAEVTAQLMEASLTGHDSHGALRAPWYMEKIEAKELIPGAPIEVERESSTTAVVNGNWGFGQPVSRFAMRLCLDKARQHGMGCVTVKNANHMGRVGFYTSMAADEGMVGMGCVNLHGASPCVAPYGGIDRRLPTNPFSIAFPTDRQPNFLMDMTTSVVAEGKLQVRRNLGKQAEPGWIIDHDGRATTDPWDFYKEPVGALLTFGGVVGYKGFGLSMAIEGLAGGLSGAPCSNPQADRHGNACWYMAMRIDAFVDPDEFRANVGRMIDHVKSSRRAEGVAEILYPGEPEHRTRLKRTVEGISIDPHTWDWLSRMCAKVGVKLDEALGRA